MKKTIFTAMLALMSLTGWAQNTVVREKSLAFMEQSNAEFEIPADWKNVTYAKDETLPVAKINKGMATLKVKLLGYKPDMKLTLWVYGFIPLGATEAIEKGFPFADDGTLTAEIPMRLAREVKIGINGLAQRSILIAPGQETSILMKLTNDQHPFLAFKGFLAKTNMNWVTEQEKQQDADIDKQMYEALSKCTTSDERLAWQEMIKDIDGDHYYLTSEQFDYLLKHYESQGIPTYAIYDSSGNQTFKEIGFPGLDPIKEAVEQMLK